MPHDISTKEAQSLLQTGLERWENYIHPAGSEHLSTISEEVMDDCWDIELYLRLGQKNSSLGTYYPDRSKDGKRHGRNFINIFSHEVDCSPAQSLGGTLKYDVRDTILHELAHHIHRKCYGHDNQSHGHKWKWICKIIGANPSAKASAVDCYPTPGDADGGIPEITELVWVAQKLIDGKEFNSIGTTHTAVDKIVAIEKGWEYK